MAVYSPLCPNAVKSKHSVLSVGSVATLLGVGSIASIASIGSISSLGSIGSIASIGSVGSIASTGKIGAIFNIPVAEKLANWTAHELEHQLRQRKAEKARLAAALKEP